MTDYTPLTPEVRNSFSLHCESFCKRCKVSEYGNCDFHEAEFDRWLAEVKAQAIAEDRKALLEIAKGRNNGCSGHECEECERIMLVDDIITSRAILMSQFEEYE